MSFWYDHVVRTMVGKLLAATGEAVYTATETASLLVSRSREIEEARRKLESSASSSCKYDVKEGEKDVQVMMLRIKNSSYSTDDELD